MRFPILVAFTLPLSALAMPALVQRQTALDDARQQVVDGLTTTANALNTTLAQAAAIVHPPQSVVIDDATEAQSDITLASAAVANIGAAIAAAAAPNEADQLHVAQGILDAQGIIDQLEGKIQNGPGDRRDGKGKGQGKGKGKHPISEEELTIALNDLRTSIGQARVGVASALQGGINVLAQQGKNISQLFTDAGLAVPPGF